MEFLDICKQYFQAFQEKDIEIIEVKQGPYNLMEDKKKFNKIDEKKIKIK